MLILEDATITSIQQLFAFCIAGNLQKAIGDNDQKSSVTPFSQERSFCTGNKSVPKESAKAVLV
jgi:hypothetical protein